MDINVKDSCEFNTIKYQCKNIIEINKVSLTDCTMSSEDIGTTYEYDGYTNLIYSESSSLIRATGALKCTSSILAHTHTHTHANNYSYPSTSNGNRYRQTVAVQLVTCERTLTHIFIS